MHFWKEPQLCKEQTMNIRNSRTEKGRIFHHRIFKASKTLMTILCYRELVLLHFAIISSYWFLITSKICLLLQICIISHSIFDVRSIIILIKLLKTLYVLVCYSTIFLLNLLLYSIFNFLSLNFKYKVINISKEIW